MSADTFLQRLAVDRLQFAIFGPLAPISIRDQMIRAKCFVERSLEAGLIGPGRPLLVVGAGAAGVTAALCAVRKSIPTWLVEKRAFAFSLQAECTTRTVHPFQYDWPRAVWEEQRFPLPGTPPMPLPWATERASVLALQWQEELRRAELDPRNLLTILYETEWVTSDPGPENATPGSWDGKTYASLPDGTNAEAFYGRLQGTFSQPERSHSGHIVFTNATAPGRLPPFFGAALYAVGFGSETTRVCQYNGPAFWTPDALEDPGLGWPDNGADRNVLISGSGDGALQDFLRVTTGLSTAAQIYERIFTGLDSPQIAAQLGRILDGEEELEDSMPFKSHSPEEHAAFIKVDQVHKREIEELLESDKELVIAKRVDSLLLRSRSMRIFLLHPCVHFTARYALNRFLTHLILAVAALDRRRIKISVLNQKALGCVKGDGGHVCNPDHAQECTNKLHSVRLSNWSDCRGSADKSMEPHPVPVHVLIVRHGVKTPDLFRDWQKNTFLRHLPPDSGCM